MHPLCIIVGISGQGMELPQADRVPRGYVARMRRKTIVFGLWLWLIVLRLLYKFELQFVPQCYNELLKIVYIKGSSEPCSVFPTDSKSLPFVKSVV
ncbi:hypothetical protein TNCV_3742751 [Trichonephila clavipes]|nr:hypothetical protein TNCV_3742751 [Trichonephila clavipes]